MVLRETPLAFKKRLRDQHVAEKIWAGSRVGQIQENSLVPSGSCSAKIDIDGKGQEESAAESRYPEIVEQLSGKTIEKKRRDCTEKRRK